MRNVRHLAIPLGLALMVGCATTEPTGLNIPANAIVYEIAPKKLKYDYVDTTVSSTPYTLHWLSDSTYTGFNCIGLVPRAAPDTTGTFVFVFSGTNTGYIKRLQNGTTDTTSAFFLPPLGFDQGTHGNYALDSSGKLKLFWADGTQSRYFDPAAVIRLHNDTLTSDFSFKASGDSVQFSWQVNWVREPRCE